MPAGDGTGTMPRDLVIPPALTGAQLVPMPRGAKGPPPKGWPSIRMSRGEAAAHVDRGGNLAMRLGPGSDDLVDVDLDCSEALALADRYLQTTGAEFGRASKPRCHRLYQASGAVYAAFADPLDGSMLLELRADGRDGGAHLTLIPPSVADGECREWHGENVEPVTVDAAVLARRCAWLAIGCLTMRHLSEYAARRPGPDLTDLLWEADPVLGHRAYHWLGRLAPDEQPPDLKPRREMSNLELRLEEIVAAIENRCSWEEWNRIGMAIFAASGGSDVGYRAFDDFSSRSPKYNSHAVLERWRNYRRSPPSRISLGTLVHLAREAGWHRSAA